MNSSENKWLIVNHGVILTPYIEPVIAALDTHFAQAQLKAYVTSGKRTNEKQLAIIIEKAKRHGIDKEFPSILMATLTGKIMWDKTQVFEWQPAWSRLLTAGEMVNPPLQAMCLFDYKRNGVLKKAGTLIGISPHQKETSFDIGGGTYLQAVADIITKVHKDKLVKGLIGFLVEKVNNAVHCDCEKLKVVA